MMTFITEYILEQSWTMVTIRGEVMSFRRIRESIKNRRIVVFWRIQRSGVI